MYNLFLDDIRDPGHVNYRTKFIEVGDFAMYRLKDWVIARTYKDFVEIVQEKGLPKLVSFDHDLADIHYTEEYQNEGVILKYKETSGEKTGYHAAQWLVDYCLDNKLPLPDFKVHSFNPVGAENIYSLLSNFKTYKP